MQQKKQKQQQQLHSRWPPFSLGLSGAHSREQLRARLAHSSRRRRAHHARAQPPLLLLSALYFLLSALCFLLGQALQAPACSSHPRATTCRESDSFIQKLKSPQLHLSLHLALSLRLTVRPSVRLSVRLSVFPPPAFLRLNCGGGTHKAAAVIRRLMPPVAARARRSLALARLASPQIGQSGAHLACDPAEGGRCTRLLHCYQTAALLDHCFCSARAAGNES